MKLTKHSFTSYLLRLDHISYIRMVGYSFERQSHLIILSIEANKRAQKNLLLFAKKLMGLELQAVS